MGDISVGIPADPASMLGTAVHSAKNFETLGITGVLFLLVLALGIMLVYKLRNDTKLASVASQLNSLTTATNNSTELSKEINNSNMKLIEHHLETIKQSIDKLESYIINMRNSNLGGGYNAGGFVGQGGFNSNFEKPTNYYNDRGFNEV